MTRFQSGVLSWDEFAVARALRLEPKEVREYFTDGRRASFVLERRLAREVLKAALAPSEGSGYDLVDSDGGKWEVRSISSGGIYFCPSHMVGKGRKFDEAGFLAKLEEIQGYIVSDITSFPDIRYWILPVAQVRRWWDRGILGKNSHLSREKVLGLLSE